MTPELRATLVKLAVPLFAIAAVLCISRLKGISWKEDLRLVQPKLPALLGWVAIWIAWVAIGEFAISTFGMEQARPWKDYPPLIVMLRILAIGLLGPAAEEIVMRGMIFFRLSRTRIGPIGAIVICAAAWAAMHVQYEWQTLVLIFLDGLVLGTARHRSGSTVVPIVMHTLGNLFSIWQSLNA